MVSRRVSRSSSAAEIPVSSAPTLSRSCSSAAASPGVSGGPGRSSLFSLFSVSSRTSSALAFCEPQPLKLGQPPALCLRELRSGLHFRELPLLQQRSHAAPEFGGFFPPAVHPIGEFVNLAQDGRIPALYLHPVVRPRERGAPARSHGDLANRHCVPTLLCELPPLPRVPQARPRSCGHHARRHGL